MLINLSNNAVLQIIDDEAIFIGWKEKPNKATWLSTKHEVEKLLGFFIVTWDAITNPKTNMFWTKIGNSNSCTNGIPLLIDLLDTN